MARRHDRPFILTLTGPAGGQFVAGDGTGQPLTLDAVEFCRILSGRARDWPRGRRRRSGVATRLAAVAAVLVRGATACGNGAADEGAAGQDTAPGPATSGPSTETGAPDSPSEPASVGGLSDQCLALIVDLLQTIEPYVAGHNAATMHSDDFDADGLAEAIAVVEEEVQFTCPPMDNPEVYETMLDLARDNAPGTVWYVELIAAAEETRSRG